MKYVKLILVIIWMIVIFMFSNEPASKSTKTSNGVIYKLASITISKKDMTTKKKKELTTKYSNIIRKLAHFLIYLVLGILVCSLLSEFNIKNLLIASLIVCVVYSTTDEIHQLFVKGRSAEVRDVIIDSCGSLVGIYGYILLFIKWKQM